MLLALSSWSGVERRANVNFIGHWLLEGNNIKMIIYERAQFVGAVKIDWDSCIEFETLEIIQITDNKIFISTRNPSTDVTIVSDFEVVNMQKLRETIKGGDVVHWNRIK